MYEMLGISLTSFRKENQELINLDSENEKSFEERPRHDPDEEDSVLTSEDDEIEKKTLQDPKQKQRKSNEYNNELVKNNNKELIPCHIEDTRDDGPSSNPNIVKKPFLKRGSGLTTRFGVSPEVFNLKNLPPYKYNDRVKKTLGRSSIDNRSNRINKRKSEPIIKVCENSDETNKQNEQKHLDNVPQNVISKKTERNIPSPNPPQTAVEKLIKVCIDQPITETPKNNMKVPKGISWAQILSENNILSCPVDPIANNSFGNILDDTELFNLLENKIGENCSETSVADLMQLLANFQNKSNEEEDDTLVEPDDPVIEEVPVGKKELFPRPDDIHISQEESSDDDSDDGSQKVRFAKAVEICDENEGVTGLLDEFWFGSY